MKVKTFSVPEIKIPTDFAEFGAERQPSTDVAGCENCKVSENALEAIKASTPSMLIDHWQSQDKQLRRELGNLHGVKPEQVFLTAGALGGIIYTFDIFADQNTRVGLLTPDFPGFRHYAQRARSQIETLESKTFPFTHSSKDITDFIKKKDICLFITSNPSAVTGTIREKDEIEAILKANPETMHIIDEADSIYPDLSAAQLANRYDNSMFLGSFSKFYGLSGLRIGYLITPPDYINALEKMINPIELTSVAILAARHALRDINYQTETQKRVEENLKLLEGTCQDTSYKIVPGSKCFASYIWADDSTEDPGKALEKEGIKINNGSYFGLPKGGRINLSDKRKISEVAEAIRRIHSR
ncbi:aminotransferase class I/II-fold pyridoxal phosphate-dependent enzyme [Candidatus Pacearchaeota archaeon]|nr:aminotransferase class I/II-fold pyridoxal phosphate-dependent enzyme [Candidatus Pacearchaeota archaeon]